MRYAALLSLAVLASAAAFAQGKKAAKPKAFKDAPAAEKACEGGDLDGCVFASEWYAIGGKGAVNDTERAKELGAKACDGGNAAGCYFAGWALAPNHKASQPFYEKGCEAGHGKSCFRLGLDAYGEYSVIRDDEKKAIFLKKALELFQRDCSAGDNAACLEEAEMYYTAYDWKVNHIIPSDPAKAAKTFKALCDKKSGRACTLLGDAYETGEVLPQDDKKAKAAYDKGCKLGAEEGCEASRALVEDRLSKGIRL